MISPGERSVCTWEEGMFCCFRSSVVCTGLFGLFGSCVFKSSVSLLVFSLVVLSFIESGILKALLLYTCLFLLQFCQFLLLIF